MLATGLRIALAASLFSFGACTTRTSDDGSTSGEADESGGENLLTDAQLRESCANGCVRFKACVPDSYDAAYADDQACEDFCFDLFDAPNACRVASVPYAACTAALECVDWPDLLNDPSSTGCAPAWADVQSACPDL